MPVRARTRAVGATALAAGLLALGAAGKAEAMSGYRWKHRPLIVIAPAPSDARLVQQQGIVAASRGGFQSRDIVVVVVAGDSVSAELGPGLGLSAAQIRARFGVGRDAFRAILVGKDGGTKLSSGTPLSAQTLFGTIDAMPMRRDEIRQRGQ